MHSLSADRAAYVIMGLLSLGTPLEWKQVREYCDHVRDHGIEQLLNIWRAHRDRGPDPLLWGDEIEYMIVQADKTTRSARLTLRQDEILDALIHAGKTGKFCGVSFHQEYGRYMLEATPAKPYSGAFDALLAVEPNMEHRRVIATDYIREDELPLTLTTYPLLGVGEFASPWDAGERPVSNSLFLPDNIINTHARFPTLTKNIRTRRGEKVDIRVPLFIDTNTTQITCEDACKHGPNSTKEIYMDSMGFGMGSSCVQLTFQAKNLSEARRLYDQLVPFAPLMMALAAAAPLYRGYISDQDVRWNVISASVDDRTDVERGVVPPPADWAQHTNNTSPVIKKSRYDSVSCYLSTCPVLTSNQDLYNDLDIVTNKRSHKQLTDAGMDPLLAQHFSHLFIRDPLVIFEELLDQDDTTSTDHFENLQSTNWQTVRFKPPPGDEIGWRVEFRSMDVQITDFENAALSVFIVLLTRVIIEYNLTSMIPISKVDENMKTAHTRDAVNFGKFWFRTEMANQTPDSTPGFKQLSLDEIFNGKAEFAGIIPLMRRYLDSNQIEPSTRAKLEQYIDLVSKRASGELWTAAKWIRNFVTGHPDYQHDSVVSQGINYDLMQAIQKVTTAETWDSDAKQMLGGMVPKKDAHNGA